MSTAPSPAPERPRSGPTFTTPRRRLLLDKLARWGVVGGGLAIIASILGILVFIAAEVWPLLRTARVVPAAEATLPSPALALLADEYRSHVALVSADNRLRAVDLASGAVDFDAELFPGATAVTAAVLSPGAPTLVAAAPDGRLAAQRIEWEVEYDAAQKRNVHPRLAPPVIVEMDPERRPLGAFAAALQEEGTAGFVAQLSDGRLVVVRREVSANLLTGEVQETFSREETTPGHTLTGLLVDLELRNIYAGTADGSLLWWNLDEGLVAPQVVSAGASPITALSLLIGDRALVVGQESGALSIWFQVRQPDETMRLTRVRDFPAHSAAITALAVSERNKGFLALDRGGDLGLYYSTSHRTLWRGKASVPGATSLAFAPKDDGVYVAAGTRLAGLDVANPHPEVTLRSLFGKVWYEGYGGPEHIWQSTGGTDDFEPKLSLTPLLVGTLKGTFFSLLLAIPLGILGAMYASQFMHPRLLNYVKPTVEIMAALPSVVLGFIAGLWLAPVVESAFPSLVLSAVLVPLLVLLAGWGWRSLPLALRNRFLTGTELFLYLGAVVAALGLAFWLGVPFEKLAFGGDYRNWLLETTGLAYDQRNAVVVGLAMGFAVIPIIFAIAEDSFSNVPRNLVAGSLALGANRWQTVTRVVLPTASPGIFSGIMIGFGRAVGETMIVLMATGNTPIMSWNPFNGFRTLSANIATEIPEAPVGGTLYRTLFLAALLLFLLTFFVNTLAEIVRQRLRRRYAQL